MTETVSEHQRTQFEQGSPAIQSMITVK